jgi:hypothetical protein
MGEPVRILDVAKRLVARAGREVEIIFTGLRPGEELPEVLVSDDEVGVIPWSPSVTQFVGAPIGTPFCGRNGRDNCRRNESSGLHDL